MKKLQKSIRDIKENREMEERFMVFEEMLKDERAEGREEGKAEGEIRKLVQMVCRKLVKGKTQEMIAEDLEEERQSWRGYVKRRRIVRQTMTVMKFTDG